MLRRWCIIIIIRVFLFIFSALPKQNGESSRVNPEQEKLSLTKAHVDLSDDSEHWVKVLFQFFPAWMAFISSCAVQVPDQTRPRARCNPAAVLTGQKRNHFCFSFVLFFSSLHAVF